MTIPTTTKNSMLDGITFTHASVHSDFPGATGANEIAGGSPAYARLAVVENVASGGQRTLGAIVEFDVPACTASWMGFWNGSTFLGAAPNDGSQPRNFTAFPSADTVAVADRVYVASHGWSDTQQVVFYNGTPPTGLTEGTIYFVRDATTHTFKVAATSGGTAIPLTSAPSFGCVVSTITPVTYAIQGIHRVMSSTFSVPD